VTPKLFGEWARWKEARWHDLPTGGVYEFVDASSGRMYELEMLVRGEQVRWFWQQEGKPFAWVQPASA